MRNGIIRGDVTYAFAKTFFQFKFISLSHSAYITSRTIMPFHSSRHMPFRKLVPPFYPDRFFSYPTQYFIATVCKPNASPTTLLEACFGWFRPLIRLKFWESPLSSFWSSHFPRPQVSLNLELPQLLFCFVLLVSSIHHITLYCRILR